jgi:adenylate kinase
MTDLNLVLLGPPGAGKGTQAERPRDDLDLCHLATGDLLRQHRAEGTALGRRAAAYMDAGGLVPDELVVTMLLDALPDDVQAGRRGFLLDGFPRTIAQADMLDGALRRTGLALTAVVMLAADDEVIVERLSGRGRSDDTPETVRRRLAVYHEATVPLVDYYEALGLLRRVDGTRPPDEVTAAIRAALAPVQTVR